ncbi:MAG: hypothetical protein IVW57_15695 [Ktedonobacterales bacterium]|nr:hypothetical protein [Ktedonobacterales bacterium]
MILFQDRKLLFQGQRLCPLSLSAAPYARRARLSREWAIRERAIRERVSARWQQLVAALTVTAGMITSATSRHWLAIALANICIVGGILAAPLISLMGWIGLALPARAPLHTLTPVLFMTAIIWLSLAIVIAHTQSGRHA